MTVDRRRLVIVSNRFPLREARDGFVPRLYQFVQAAAESMEVKWIWARPPGHEYPSATTEPRPARVLDAPRAPWQESTTQGRLLRLLGQYSFDPLPYDCYPRKWPLLRRTLAEQRPDVVVFYLPFLAHLVTHVAPEIPVIAVLEEGWEDVYTEWLRGSATKKAWLARRERARYARVYRLVNRRASVAVAISSEERDRFSKSIDPLKLVVLPHGVDLGYYTPRDGARRDIDVLVVGDLKAARNCVGALRTWRAARCDSGSGRWTWAFVGRIDEMTASELKRGGATVTGVVDDVRPYYERARAVLVPAVAGSGTKSTSIQAWAMRRPLVASPVGARGLPARPFENVVIGDVGSPLVRRLGSVLTQPEFAERLAEAGRHTAERSCDMSVIAQDFARLCLEVAERGRVDSQVRDRTGQYRL